MPQGLVFEKKMWYKAETNGSKMIKFGANHPRIGAMCHLLCDSGIRKYFDKSYRHLNGDDAQKFLWAQSAKRTRAKRAKCERQVLVSKAIRTHLSFLKYKTRGSKATRMWVWRMKHEGVKWPKMSVRSTRLERAKRPRMKVQCTKLEKAKQPRIWVQSMKPKGAKWPRMWVWSTKPKGAKRPRMWVQSTKP